MAMAQDISYTSCADSVFVISSNPTVYGLAGRHIHCNNTLKNGTIQAKGILSIYLRGPYGVPVGPCNLTTETSPYIPRSDWPAVYSPCKDKFPYVSIDGENAVPLRANNYGSGGSSYSFSLTGSDIGKGVAFKNPDVGVLALDWAPENSAAIMPRPNKATRIPITQNRNALGRLQMEPSWILFRH